MPDLLTRDNIKLYLNEFIYGRRGGDDNRLQNLDKAERERQWSPEAATRLWDSQEMWREEYLEGLVDMVFNIAAAAVEQACLRPDKERAEFIFHMVGDSLGMTWEACIRMPSEIVSLYLGKCCTCDSPDCPLAAKYSRHIEGG
jgi:hypothetical protein